VASNVFAPSNTAVVGSNPTYYDLLGHGKAKKSELLSHSEKSRLQYGGGGYWMGGYVKQTGKEGRR
jgi:hypothetical protein